MKQETHMTSRNVFPALITACMVLALSACNPLKSGSYSHISPESLLDVSSEVVNLSVRDQSDLEALTAWVEKDAPTRAELFCDSNSKNCTDAAKILESRDVNVSVTASPNNTVTLVYERIVARDCNARFLDQGFSVRNNVSPSFGCSVSANTVQHVSDKREFISPELSDDPSAVGMVSAVRRGLTPSKTGATATPYGVNASTVNSSGSGSSQ